MDMTRRQAVLAGLALMATGCASSKTVRSARPDPWTVRGHVPFDQRPRPTGPVQHVHRRPQAPTTPVAVPRDDLGIIARANWTRSAPTRTKVNAMKGVTRITVHHEGWKPVYFGDTRSTADRIELIRTIHTRDRGWGDIGYHYIVCREGKVWEGRPIAYQGAHVRQNNEHNLGILVLGNFDKQRPSDPQLDAMVKAIKSFQATHKVAKRRVYTHQEIVATACPGRNLQNKMAGVRRHLA